MKNISLILFAVQVCFLNGQSENQPLKLYIQLDKKETHPFDELRFVASIINVSKENIDMKTPWVAYFQTLGYGAKPLIECRYSTDTIWHKMLDSRRGGLSIEPLEIPNYTIGSNDTISSKTIELIPVSHTDKVFQFHFEKPGEYYLRAYYPTYYTNRSGEKEILHLYSQEEKIIVSAYAGENANTYQWLMSTPIPHFIYLDVYEYKKIFSKISDLKLLDSSIRQNVHILESQYPNSRFTPWGKYFLSQYYLWLDPERRTNKEKRFTKAEEVLFSLQNEGIEDAYLSEKVITLLKVIQKYK